MATPRDLAWQASARRAQDRINNVRLTPRQKEAASLALRRMTVTERGYTGPLTREELARRTR